MVFLEPLEVLILGDNVIGLGCQGADPHLVIRGAITRICDRHRTRPSAASPGTPPFHEGRGGKGKGREGRGVSKVGK